MLCLLLGTGWFSRIAAQPTDYEYVCGTSGSSSSSSGGPENPICTDPNSIRFIRVAIHFLLRENTWIETITDNCGGTAVPPYSFTYVGPGNFTEISDGVQITTYNGFKHAENLIGLANEMLATNETQWRKTTGINYPNNPPINIQYLLVGAYFHRDNDAFNPSIPETAIHAKYDVETNNVLDIYCIHRTNLPYDGNGFEFGGFNKFVYLNDYKLYLKPYCREWSKINTAHSMNHEIVHTLNLYHTWNSDDACTDTPLGFIYDKIPQGGGCFSDFANCWSYDPNKPGCPKKPCGKWSKISNNVMDYNVHDPAWTVCQIGRMNQNLLGNGNSYIHSCNGCAPSQAFFYAKSPHKICPPQSGLNSDVHINGVASVNENRFLIEICEVLGNQPTNCIGAYFTSGWQTGQVGDINLSTLYNFQPDKFYKIKLTVDNTECPGKDVHEQLIQTLDCAEVPPCCYEMAALNPFGDYLTVYYNTPENGEMSLALINLYSGNTTELFSPTEILLGEHQQDFQTSGLPAGTYSLRAIFNGVVYTKNILKL